MAPLQHDKGDMELFSVYVPTNHVYVGDIFLLGKADIIKTNLSVREGLGEPQLPPCLRPDCSAGMLSDISES